MGHAVNWGPRVALVLASFSLGVGCTSGTEGELGVCDFEYHCVDYADSSCEPPIGFSFGGYYPIPPLVGVEAMFVLTTPHCGMVRPASNLHVATTEVDSSEESAFRLLDPGYHSFLTFEVDGTVRDFVNVRAADAASLFLREGIDELVALEIEVGEERVIKARPLDINGEDVAGSYDYAWQSSNPLCATVTKVDGDRRAVVHGVQPGVAEIEVLGGTLSASFTLTVVAP